MSSSLVTTTEKVKKILIGFAIFAVVVILGRACIDVVGRLTTPAAVTATEQIYLASNDKFGPLTPLPLTSLTTLNGDTTEFLSDNAFNSLPFQAVNTYKIEEPRERFQAEDDAAKISNAFDFETRPTRTDTSAERKLIWNEKGRQLEINKITGSYIYSNPTIEAPAPSGNFDNDKDYIDQAYSLGSRLGVPGFGAFTADNVRIDFLNAQGNSYVSSISPSTASYMKIRYYRKFAIASLAKDSDLDSYQASNGKTYSNVPARELIDNYLSAPLEIVVAGNGSQNPFVQQRVIYLRYNDWYFKPEKGVYSIYSPTEAWDQVKTGKGALKELLEDGFNRYQNGQLKGQEVLRYVAEYQKVEIAYLEPNTWSTNQDYLMPIYIFKGRARLASSPEADNAEFTIITPAIKFSN